MAYYYADYTNGNESATGLRIPVGDYNSTSYNSIDSSADATHFVDAALSGTTFYSGAFVVVYQGATATVRGTGLVSSFNDGTDEITLQGAGISGMSSGDNYYILQSWKTLNKIATTCASGDYAYIRAATTEVPTAIINFTNDGTPDAPITVTGCTSTIDPYKDSSNTKPIIDFTSTAYYIYIYGDYYWSFSNITFQGSDIASHGVVDVADSPGAIFTNCVFQNAANSSGWGGLFLNGNTSARFVNCSWVNNDYVHIRADLHGRAEFIGCTFTGGAEGADYGFSIAAGMIFLDNCTFDTGAATTDLYFPSLCKAVVTARNCEFGTDTKYSFGATGNEGVLYVEDWDGTYGVHGIYKYQGTVTKDTTNVRSGGASSSANMAPASSQVIRYPLCLSGYSYSPDLRVWCPADETTITVYVKGYGWSTYPTASQLWLEAEYVTSDTTDSITRATAVSTEVIDENTNWHALTVTITPHVASFVNLKVYLNLYTASCGVYVDVEPILTWA